MTAETVQKINRGLELLKQARVLLGEASEATGEEVDKISEERIQFEPQNDEDRQKHDKMEEDEENLTHILDVVDTAHSNVDDAISLLDEADIDKLETKATE